MDNDSNDSDDFKEIPVARKAVYLFFRSDKAPHAGIGQLGAEYEWGIWKPSLSEVMPRGIQKFRRRFAARWLMHQLRLFSSRDYQVLVIRHRSTEEVVHYSGATGRYWRWPFMQANDIQIGDTWTHPSHRGRGLAKFALAQLLKQFTQPERRNVWYVVDEENDPSISIARACGMIVVGKGGRTTPHILKFLHAYRPTVS